MMPTASPLASTETDQPRTPRTAGSGLMPRDSDDDPRLPLPTDDEIPQETLNMLGQARDALVRLVSAVFQAATRIVAALLGLVQEVAGRRVADAVDRKVASTIDPFIPDGPRSEEVPTSDPPSPERPPSTEEPPAESRSDRAVLRDGVRDILETYARTDEEREALSPAFVEMVTTGTQFLLSVERQFPGAIDAFQAQERSERPPEAPRDANPEAVRPEAPTPEPAVTEL